MSADLRVFRSDPFELLVQLEGRLRATRLDAVAGQTQAWVGLGFRLDRQWFLTPQTDVREVIVPPPAARVPNAQPWLKGVANVRGNLLTVVDLQQLLFQVPTPENRANRILVFNSERSPIGFLVHEVVGYRQFGPADQNASLLEPMGATKPYLLGGFTQTGQDWLVMSLHRIASADILKQAGW